MTRDVAVDQNTVVVDIRAVRRKGDRSGVGQLASLAAVPAWGGACPARIISE